MNDIRRYFCLYFIQIIQKKRQNGRPKKSDLFTALGEVNAKNLVVVVRVFDASCLDFV